MDLATGMEIAMVLSSRGRGSEKVKQECIIFRNPEAAFAKGGGFRLKTRLARGYVERCCSCGGPEFGSQHSCLVTHSHLGEPTSSSGL